HMLSLHDALPISACPRAGCALRHSERNPDRRSSVLHPLVSAAGSAGQPWLSPPLGPHADPQSPAAPGPSGWFPGSGSARDPSVRFEAPAAGEATAVSAGAGTLAVAARAAWAGPVAGPVAAAAPARSPTGLPGAGVEGHRCRPSLGRDSR